MMITLNRKPCIVCNERQRQTGSYCNTCRADYQRQYIRRRRKRQQAAQHAPPAEADEPMHPRMESRLQIAQARIEQEEAALRAAGFNPDTISAAQAERVLSQAVGQV